MHLQKHRGSELFIFHYKANLWAGMAQSVQRLATGWTFRGSNIGEGRCSAPAQTGPGAYSISYTTGTGSFPGVKRPRRGVDHPPHLAPRLKKGYSDTSTPPMGLRGLFKGELYKANRFIIYPYKCHILDCNYSYTYLHNNSWIHWSAELESHWRYDRKGLNVQTFLDIFGTSERNHRVVSKRRALILKWGGATSQKKSDFF